MNPLPHGIERSSPELGIFKIQTFGPCAIQLFVKNYSGVKMLSILSKLYVFALTAIRGGGELQEKMVFNKQPSPALLKYFYFEVMETFLMGAFGKARGMPRTQLVLFITHINWQLKIVIVLLLSCRFQSDVVVRC